MPNYRLTYVVETCLEDPRDLAFDHQGNRVTLLFSAKQRNETTVRVVTEVSANTAWEAQATAQGSTLPPVLDAVAYSTGAPLFLLGHCELTLKDEAGDRRRRAIYIGQRRSPRPLLLSELAIEEARRVLAQANAPKLPLRWMRYSYHRPWVLDKFVFTWLAFEELAGDTDIEHVCSRCGEHSAHRGANRRRGYELVAAAGDQIAENDFNERIWGRARNSIFHGSREPDPAFLGELGNITDRLWRASSEELRRSYGLDNRARNPLGLDLIYNVFLFVEWETQHPAAQFATDFPHETVARIVGDAEYGGAVPPLDEGVRLLDMREAQTW